MKWGIIGLGNISNRFADALKVIDDAEIAAVASRNQAKADDFAERHHAQKAYDSYEKLFQDEEVQVVYIGTPHVFHAENAIAAMEHGKAVLCEKPIAMNRKQAQAMFDCAKANNVFLMEALWTRFIPSFQKAKALIENGTIGEVKNIIADFGFRSSHSAESRVFNRQLGGGSILDVGIYPIFVAVSILGKPKSIRAFAILNAQQTDDACNMIFEYDNALASLTSSLVANQQVEATIFGTEGTVRLNNRFHEPTTVSVLRQFEEVERFTFEETGNGMQYQAIEVQQCIQRGEIESKLMSWQDSLLLNKVMDAVRKDAGVSYEWD